MEPLPQFWLDFCTGYVAPKLGLPLDDPRVVEEVKRRLRATASAPEQPAPSRKPHRKPYQPPPVKVYVLAD